MRGIAMLLWRILALVLLALGLIGIFLPVVPTEPFVIAAAWTGGRGWPALERWLLADPRLGPTIRQWRQSGAVPRRAKWAAIGMMALSSGVLVFFVDVAAAVKIAAPLLMALVGVWLWRRPEP